MTNSTRVWILAVTLAVLCGCGDPESPDPGVTIEIPNTGPNTNASGLCAADHYVEDGECVPCAPGAINEAGDFPRGPDTSCDVVLCGPNEHVVGNACVPCADGTNIAGDDPTGPDTRCTLSGCRENFYVSDYQCVPCEPGTVNSVGDNPNLGVDTRCFEQCGQNERAIAGGCAACPPGSTNAAGDSAEQDTQCDPILCQFAQHVQNHVCVDCPPGSTRGAGDNASGPDTMCRGLQCTVDRRVQNHACVDCPPGTTNAAGDDASGPDTMCDASFCPEDEYVSTNMCVACPPESTNVAGDLTNGPDTMCDDGCLPILGVTCAEFNEAYMKPATPQGRGEFGHAVAMSGNTLVVGAPESGTLSIAVRTGNTWSYQSAGLKPAASEQPDRLGHAVDIDGDTIIVGAPNEGGSSGLNGNELDNNAPMAGAAYIFVRNGSTWTQQAYLKPPSPLSVAFFGISVAIDGDTAVVGSEELGPGAVFIFHRVGTTWTLQQEIQSPVGGSNDAFGRAIALAGDTLAVGIPGREVAALWPGGVYIYTRSGSTWTQRVLLEDPDHPTWHFFGLSVALDGSTLLAGHNNPTVGDGVRIYTGSGANWVEQAHLTKQGVDFHFGSSIGLDGDLMVLGEPGNRSGGIGLLADQADASLPISGGAYLFERVGSSWNELAFFNSSNPDQSDQFGYSVALDGGILAIGALSEDSGALGFNGDQTDNSSMSAGAVYIRKVRP